MKTNRKSKYLKASITAMLVVSLGFTTAYLVDSTNSIVNTFDPNKVQVEIEETTGQHYDIVPGTEQDKDPKVEVDATVDSYVYVVVVDAANTGDVTLVNYSVIEGEDGWIPLDDDVLGSLDVDGDGQIDFELNDTMKVYYRIVNASEKKQSFYVLKDNKVSYDSTLTNDDMPSDKVMLGFRAFAVQKEPFADAVTAWNRTL